MAETARGRKLTDAHRRKQVRIATRADSRLRRAMGLLNPNDINGTRMAWQRQMVSELSGWYGMSANEAEVYLARFRVAELGSVSGPVVKPAMNYGQAASTLDTAGPIGFKQGIAAGLTDDHAFKKATSQVLAEAHKIIMAAGRGVVRESARADSRAIGWRRVTDGDPCTFCAMLCSRGPAYTSEAKALSKAGSDDPYHSHCGCTVEVVYGDWVPTEAEQVYVDAYHAAAEAAEADGQARTAKTVLYRMRDASDFRDSPARRTVGK